jgi:multicomponent Na+:H+ antiporter subunit E
MSARGGRSGFPLRSALVRGIFFVIVWIAMIGVDPVDLVVGLCGAAIATAVSLMLLPPGQFGFGSATLILLPLRFLKQSAVAGVDVALRALDPRLPLKPGFIVFKPTLPPGPQRDAFCTLTSLLPGTLPSGAAEGGGVLIHCLDTDQPVAQQLAAEEALFAKAIGARKA